MRRALPKLLAALLAFALLAPAEAAGASGELIPVAGTSWQSSRIFAIEWDPIAPADPTEAVYEIYDSQGQLALSFRRPVALMSKDVVMPPSPDVYKLEAWLENSSGGRGPASAAIFHFDSAPPTAPELDSPPGWILGTATVAVGVERSADPPPLSGIDGYAVSVDGGFPCSDPDRCHAAEIDIADPEGGVIALGTLPEGVHFVRAVAVSGAGVPSQVATAVVSVDGSAPLLSFDGVPAGWSDRPVLVTARATDGLSGMAAAGPPGPFTALSVDGAAPARAYGDAVGSWVSGSGAHVVVSHARDSAGNLSGDERALVRIDEDPPRVAFAATQDPAEPERIEASASDLLSGPSPERGSISVRLAGTRAAFQPLPTRNAGSRLVAAWDSDSYPSGKYEFAATAYDTAGNSATGRDRAQGSRMVLVNPLKAQVEIEAEQGRRRFTGRLRRAGAGPMAGQDVLVTETFAVGAKPRQRATVVTTDRQGAFALRLRPGPSREVVARFAGTPVLSRAVSSGVHLDPATAIRFRASAPEAKVGGRPIVFSGRVSRLGAATVAGLPVALQFRFRGEPWSEFRTVEADARGRFHYRYRFSDDDSHGVRFQFRAHVKGREGWPYGPGTSRPVKVTGR